MHVRPGPFLLILTLMLTNHANNLWAETADRGKHDYVAHEIPGLSTLDIARLTSEFKAHPPLQFGQPWNESKEQGFRGGEVKVGYSATHLFISATLEDDYIFNQAEKLNDKAWMLGDIFEILLINPENQFYWEIQITPDNQKLQIKWPMSGPKSINDEHPLESFFVYSEAIIATKTMTLKGQWQIFAAIPFINIGKPLTGSTNSPLLRASFCRYDYSSLDNPPILSSTSPYQEPRFHRLDEFTTIHFSSTRE